MEQKTEHEHAKKNFEQNSIDAAEKKLDSHMEKFSHKRWRVDKFLNHKVVKDVVNSKVASDVNEKLHPYLKTIFLVIWWLSIVSGIIGIFSFLVWLSGLGFIFSFGAGMGIRVLIYILLALVFSLLSLLTGIGMIRLKKWVIFLLALWFAVSVITLIISLFPSGFAAYRSYGSFGWSLLNLVLTAILLIVALKNKEMFSK